MLATKFWGAVAALTLTATLAGPSALGRPVPVRAQDEAPVPAGQRLSAELLSYQQHQLSSAAIDRKLRGQGYRVVSTGGEPVLLRSGAGDVKLYPPTLVHDEGARWYWMARYAWQNTDYSAEQHWSCRFYDACKLPGKDGFGMVFNKVLTMTGYWATFGPRSGSGHRILDPWERNRWGVVYKKQDIVYRAPSPDDLNMYYGNIVVAVRGRPCGTTSAWTKLAHTWDDSTLPGVTIGSSVINFQFGSDGQKWQKASQPGLNTRNC